MNTQAIKIIDEMIKEVELCDNGGNNLKKAIQEGVIFGLKLAHKKISSLPSLDIDNLQRYDSFEYKHGVKRDNGEYIRYDDLLNLLKNDLSSIHSSSICKYCIRMKRYSL